MVLCPVLCFGHSLLVIYFGLTADGSKVDRKDEQCESKMVGGADSQ